MVTLRLFAGLREVAGAARVEIEGDTVGEVLDGAVARFGPRFGDSLKRARVWVNGEEASREHAVRSGDELALLPPVSGGALDGGPDLALPLLPFSLIVLLVLADLAGGVAPWAAAVVLVSAVWVMDAASTASSRGRELTPVPALVTIVAALVAVHLLGAAGFGVAVAAAVILTMCWGVASEGARIVTTMAGALVVSLVAGTATAGLLLVRSEFVEGPEAAGVFLAVVAAAAVAGLLAERFPRLPLADPFTATVLAAVTAALVAAAVWDLDLVVFLIVGPALAMGLLAGRGLGSMLRTGEVVLLDRPPGAFSMIDGAMLAASLYLPVLTLVA